MFINDAWNILKTNFHLALQNNLLLAIAYLLLIPVFRGIANLNSIYSAECLEQSVTLIGILLIVPLLAPEQNAAIREVLFTKPISQWKILFTRVILSLITLIILTCTFAGIMIWNGCTFPYWNYVAGTIISELALGNIGFFTAVITHSTLTGYFISIGYFLLNFLGNISSQSIFYLFSMGTENYITKLWLTGISILFLSATFIYGRKVH
ncbi:MAG TPA: hypothetical protein IAC96_05745 [Candidatus Fimimorpha faecalis]|uniref:ABC-2 family transporter protein n=1 Tax=Candidatus Fimimorpha faecalis TaxID=2840824 RepID=A0A9D1EDK8_9FIRM|nr:hypothetical protein [Candidatus Fimimorpha faecalis]